MNDTSDTQVQLTKPDDDTETVRQLFNQMKGEDAPRYAFSHKAMINEQQIYVFRNIYNYRFVNVMLNEDKTALKPYFG